MSSVLVACYSGAIFTGLRPQRKAASIMPCFCLQKYQSFHRTSSLQLHQPETLKTTRLQAAPSAAVLTFILASIRKCLIYYIPTNLPLENNTTFILNWTLCNLKPDTFRNEIYISQPKSCLKFEYVLYTHVENIFFFFFALKSNLCRKKIRKITALFK